MLELCTGFDWDQGNSIKNWLRPTVAPIECEQIFFNLTLIVTENIKHSEKEKRYYALGKTNLNREIFLVFTVRKNLIRVISARDMSRKERSLCNEPQNT